MRTFIQQRSSFEIIFILIDFESCMQSEIEEMKMLSNMKTAYLTN